MSLEEKDIRQEIKSNEGIDRFVHGERRKTLFVVLTFFMFVLPGTCVLATIFFTLLSYNPLPL